MGQICCLILNVMRIVIKSEYGESAEEDLSDDSIKSFHFPKSFNAWLKPGYPTSCKQPLRIHCTKFQKLIVQVWLLKCLTRFFTVLNDIQLKAFVMTGLSNSPTINEDCHQHSDGRTTEMHTIEDKVQINV